MRLTFRKFISQKSKKASQLTEFCVWLVTHKDSSKDVLFGSEGFSPINVAKRSN